jgi:adenine-specific DNA-methyltransferase
MENQVESIKHITDTRAHIPSKEEAGYEAASEKVITGNKVLPIPKNPVVHRGQDPELFWLNKYANDDREDLLRIDIRSLYRHEHIAPETLIKNLYTIKQTKQSANTQQLDLFDINQLFGNAFEIEEIEKVSEYYKHQDGWTNRMILGDSLLVMASLLEREGMAGQIQTIYIDPPYGIRYGSNWQIKLNELQVKDGNDEALTAEPEQIKAYRDTWELGIHSYLSYIRDRLLIAKELLADSGSCFVQISDENVHLVRCIMDEVFGSENFISMISYATTGGLTSSTLSRVGDRILWFAKDKSLLKYRQLYIEKDLTINDSNYKYLELSDKEYRTLTEEERANPKLYDKNKLFAITSITSQHSSSKDQRFIFENQTFIPPKNRQWTPGVDKMPNLAKKNRILKTGNTLSYKRYFTDFPVNKLTNIWNDTSTGGDYKLYVVQTNDKVIQRCILMTTDPGDLVLDPTCGSGTTAFVAEKWGRRWITIDTSRIALNIAKQRLMTAVFPYYKLYDEQAGDIRQGFKYKTVPHITIKSLANDEPPEAETLYDQPEIDKNKLRVSGPFTVETLQSFDPVSPEALDENESVDEFEEVIKQHLMTAGIKNGRKDERAVFRSVELLSDSYLHAEGFYITEKGEDKAYFHIGPRFGTVSKAAVNEAIKECRRRGDANWLIILGFSFESDISGGSQSKSMGTFQVDKVRMHDDLLQAGLKKRPAKSAASFVTIGEPDIALIQNGETVQVEIKGLDIYDPIKDEIKARNVHEIAYWMVDDDYDGSNFVVKQVFFCGGDKSEFDKWKKGLDNLAKESSKKKVQQTLRIEIDDEAFDRLYGHISHPIVIQKRGQRIAVRIISLFGEECTKVLTVAS